MSDPALLTLLDEVRGRTLRLTEGVSDSAARWAPPGLENTLLWHAGHAYILAEWLPKQALGLIPQAPAGWFELFGWNSRPASVPAERWPRLADVAARLREQHDNLRELLTELSDAQLSAPARNHPERSVRYAFVHALHDEACHSGEMWLLRKMLARRLRT